MADIKALRKKDINPDIVLAAIQKNVDQIQDLFVVTIGKDGVPVMYATGDLSKLAIAQLALQDLALKYLNGRIIED